MVDSIASKLSRVEILENGYNAILEFIDKMEQLSEIQNRVDITSSINQIWNFFVGYIPNLIKVDTCALFLVDEDSHEFVMDKVWPQKDADLCQQEIDYQIECGTFSWIINRRQPAIVPPMVVSETKTVILLPLCTLKRTLGMVMVITSIDYSSITQENMRLLAMLAKQYALVLENTLLYDKLRKEHLSLEKATSEIKILSITDPLTKVYNRGYLTERLPQEIKRAKRYDHPLSIIMCDIDFFKKINDTYGHLMGDDVLRGFARIISSMIRSDVDWIARYGGEEFLVVLPVTDISGAIHQAERLRSSVEKAVFGSREKPISLTASFGVTGFKVLDGTKNLTSEELIGMADKNLYEAKKKGRNMVVGAPVF